MQITEPFCFVLIQRYTTDDLLRRLCDAMVLVLGLLRQTADEMSVLDRNICSVFERPVPVGLRRAGCLCSCRGSLRPALCRLLSTTTYQFRLLRTLWLLHLASFFDSTFLFALDPCMHLCLSTLRRTVLSPLVAARALTTLGFSEFLKCLIHQSALRCSHSTFGSSNAKAGFNLGLYRYARCYCLQRALTGPFGASARVAIAGPVQLLDCSIVLVSGRFPRFCA